MSKKTWIRICFGHATSYHVRPPSKNPKNVRTSSVASRRLCFFVRRGSLNFRLLIVVAQKINFGDKYATPVDSAHRSPFFYTSRVHRTRTNIPNYRYFLVNSLYDSDLRKTSIGKLSLCLVAPNFEKNLNTNSSRQRQRRPKSPGNGDFGLSCGHVLP